MTDTAAATILELFPPGRARRVLFYLVKHREQVDRGPCGRIVIHCGPDDKVSIADERPEDVTYD